MAVTRRLWVFPLCHQVEIRDATDDVDRPLWETGEERILASAQCIVLATRSDLEGEVEIEVRVDTDREERTAEELLFDGELLTTGQGIVAATHSRTCTTSRYRSAGIRSASMATHPPTRPGSPS